MPETVGRYQSAFVITEEHYNPFAYAEPGINPDAGLLPVPAPASSLPHRPDATFASAAGEGRLPVRVPVHAHAVQHAGRAGPRRSAFAAGPAGADTERPRLLPAFALLGHGGAARGARPLPEAVCRARVHLGRPLLQEGSGPSDALPSRKALLSDGLPSLRAKCCSRRTTWAPRTAGEASPRTRRSTSRTSRRATRRRRRSRRTTNARQRALQMSRHRPADARGSAHFSAPRPPRPRCSRSGTCPCAPFGPSPSTTATASQTESRTTSTAPSRPGRFDGAVAVRFGGNPAAPNHLDNFEVSSPARIMIIHLAPP